ncbi:MAG: hypothetical protein ACFFEV_00605, partial [Candidatus Thorarchaeota archaeon]
FAGRNYTALGGSNQTVIWKGYERYFRPGTTIRKAGVTATQIHELGHALGLQHTFLGGRYEADFHYGQMGYFGRHEKYSTFEWTWLRASYLDNLRNDLYKDFLDATKQVPDPWQQKTLDARQYAEDEFANEITKYNLGDWNGAYESLRKAENWTQRMLYSLTEDIPPEFQDIGVSPENVQPGELVTVYANITDSDSSICEVYVFMDLENGSIIIGEPEWNGTHYTCDLSWPSDSNSIALQIEATDQAMNTGISEVLSLVDTINPLVTEPVDITYNEGETGNTIIWTPSDSFPDSYQIIKDGTTLKTGQWNTSSESVSIIVDSLEIGSYNYTIVVFDTIGNAGSDTVFVHVIDGTPPTIDNPPDIEYVENTSGNMITWNPNDLHPVSYEIFNNSISLGLVSWTLPIESISIVVDGLSPGEYNFTIVVVDAGGNSIADTVFVTVTAETTTTTTTTTTSTTTTSTTSTTGDGVDITQIIMIVAVGAIIVIVVVISCRRK